MDPSTTRKRKTAVDLPFDLEQESPSESSPGSIPPSHDETTTNDGTETANGISTYPGVDTMNKKSTNQSKRHKSDGLETDDQTKSNSLPVVSMSPLSFNSSSASLTTSTSGSSSDTDDELLDFSKSTAARTGKTKESDDQESEEEIDDLMKEELYQCAMDENEPADPIAELTNDVEKEDSDDTPGNSTNSKEFEPEKVSSDKNNKKKVASKKKNKKKAAPKKKNKKKTSDTSNKKDNKKNDDTENLGVRRKEESREETIGQWLGLTEKFRKIAEGTNQEEQIQQFNETMDAMEEWYVNGIDLDRERFNASEKVTKNHLSTQGANYSPDDDPEVQKLMKSGDRNKATKKNPCIKFMSQTVPKHSLENGYQVDVVELSDSFCVWDINFAVCKKGTHDKVLAIAMYMAGGESAYYNLVLARHEAIASIIQKNYADPSLKVPHFGYGVNQKKYIDYCLRVGSNYISFEYKSYHPHFIFMAKVWDPNQRTFNVLTAGKIDEMNIEFVKETFSEGRCPRRHKLYKVRDKSYLIRSFLKDGAPKGTPRDGKEEHYRELAEHYEQLAEYHREQNSKFMKAWWASRTPDERAAHNKKLQDGKKTWLENMTPEERAAHNKKLQDGRKTWLENMTPDERAAHNKKLQDANKTWRENMTPDKRAADSKNKSDAAKKRYENIKANKPPRLPIRDPFFFFTEEMCYKMPDIPNQKRSAILKKQWKDLDPQKKKLYQDQVDRDIARYEEELIQYNQRIQ